MILSDFSVKHPAIITIVLVSLALFAGLSLRGLKSEMIPAVSMPGLSILTIYPGASASEVEKELSRQIENQLSTLPGMTNLTSISSPSYSVVSVEFSADTDARAMQPQVRELLNAIKGELPDGVEGDPVIHIFEASSLLPIFSTRIQGSMSRAELSDWVQDNVSPRLARIPGVSSINIVGGQKKEIAVTLDSAAMAARSLSALQVLQAMQYSNRNIPVGMTSWQGLETSFTSLGALSSLEELGSLPVGQAGNDIIYLRDIAEIAVQPEKSNLIIRSAGQDFIMLDILKRDEGDTIHIAKEATKVLKTMEKESRGAITYAVITDQSETTSRSLMTVVESALTGLVLTILIILLSLHDFRATLIIGVSVPLSIFFAIISIWVSGRSLNLLSLSGLTVAIGMIVDNSIVVLEKTWNKFGLGLDKKQAAREGAGELGGAVLASTTTSVCVFVPLLFLTGIIGIIMNDLSLTIVYALASSALVAVMVVPWLSSLLLKREDLIKRPQWMVRIKNSIDRVFNWVETSYRRVLIAVLNHKFFTLMLALTLFAAGIILLSILEISFLPPTDTGEFEIHIETPAGYNLEQTLKKVDEIDALVSSLVPEIEAAVYYAGSTSALALTTSSNRAFGRIRLVDSRKRKRRVQQLIPLLQKELATHISDADIVILNGGFDSLLALGTGGQGFRMEIYGNNLDYVIQGAEMAQAILEKDPNIFKTTLSSRTDSNELLIDLSLSWMASLGITPYEAGITSRILYSGMDVGRLRFPENSKDIHAGADYPIRLCSDFSDRPMDQSSLSDMAIRTSDGRYISFASFAELSNRESLSSIERRDRSFSIELVGYLNSQDVFGVASRMEAAMNNLNMPVGTDFTISGTSALIDESMSSLILVLAVAIFLVYAVMVIQFERFLQPLLIMSSIPFTLVGVVLGLYLFGSSLSIIAMLAIITLGGTVVNNAIVLVDAFNRRRTKIIEEGQTVELREVVLDESRQRLRPILMTALTTLFGVLPMALAQGNGSEIYAPLGQAIFGGLLSSTLITLIFIPLGYEALESRLQRHRPLIKGENYE